jgi:coproporphyrinogen III oxidase-like Fe-S oxidoreductase
MRRPQTKESFIKVFESARKLGIPYINIDLIAGLEKQSIQSFVSDLKLVLKLGADMVHVTGFTPLSHTLFCKAGKKLSLSQKQDREIMIAKSREIIRKFFKEIKAENSGSSEEAANIQETDIRKENSSLLGIGYSAQSHAFSQVWYEHPHLVIKKNKPDYKKLPIFRGVRGNLDEEMRKFIFNNLQKGFSRRFFYKLFKRDVLLVFNQEITELVKLRKLKIENDQIISNIKKRKEFLIFSKLFYSRKRIQAIFLAHKNEYQENKDYQQELDTLYADAA